MKAKKTQFNTIGIAPGETRSKANAAAMNRRRKAAAECHDSAMAALADFDRGAHIFGLNRGQFSMIDLASAVLEKTGPADVSVWTWVIAEYEIEAVGGFVRSGLIRSFRMVLDWTGAQREMPYIRDLQDKFGADCLRVTKTHAKIITASTDCGWRVVVRGSMNLNKNPRFEQFDVSDDPAVFDVVRGLEDEFWRRGEPIPVQKLEHSDATSLLAPEGEALDLPDWAAKGKGSGWF